MAASTAGLATVIFTAGPFAARPTPAAQTGRIEGTATITRSSRGSRSATGMAPDSTAASGLVKGAGSDELTNVIIYLDSAPASGKPGPRPRYPWAMSQADERFLPHVLPVTQGALVEFPNRDRVFHSVFSLSSARAFDLGRYPGGGSRSVFFEKPGIVQVFCHIHADMSGIILVLQNPYFAMPDSTGRFSIAGIPPGEYRVIAWHERISPIVRTLQVAGGRTARLDLDLPIPDDRDARVQGR